MKKIFFIALVLISCNSNYKLNATETSDQLKAAMQTFLNQQPASREGINFTVQSVAFFYEKNYYLCEFKVHMTSKHIDSSSGKLIDTVGVMKATIDKDFVKVTRTY